MNNKIEKLYKGLNILFAHPSILDLTDSDLKVIHKTAELTSEPEHSNSCYIFIATTEELPQQQHDELLQIDNWRYEYPYYVYYML